MVGDAWFVIDFCFFQPSDRMGARVVALEYSRDTNYKLCQAFCVVRQRYDPFQAHVQPQKNALLRGTIANRTKY